MVFETLPVFHSFFANVNDSLPSHRYYSGFCSRGANDLPRYLPGARDILHTT